MRSRGSASQERTHVSQIPVQGPAPARAFGAGGEAGRPAVPAEFAQIADTFAKIGRVESVIGRNRSYRRRAQGALSRCCRRGGPAVEPFAPGAPAAAGARPPVRLQRVPAANRALAEARGASDASSQSAAGQSNLDVATAMTAEFLANLPKDVRYSVGELERFAAQMPEAELNKLRSLQDKLCCCLPRPLKHVIDAMLIGWGTIVGHLGTAAKCVAFVYLVAWLLRGTAFWVYLDASINFSIDADGKLIWDGMEAGSQRIPYAGGFDYSAAERFSMDQIPGLQGWKLMRSVAIWGSTGVVTAWMGKTLRQTGYRHTRPRLSDDFRDTVTRGIEEGTPIVRWTRSEGQPGAYRTALPYLWMMAFGLSFVCWASDRVNDADIQQMIEVLEEFVFDIYEKLDVLGAGVEILGVVVAVLRVVAKLRIVGDTTSSPLFWPWFYWSARVALGIVGGLLLPWTIYKAGHASGEARYHNRLVRTLHNVTEAFAQQDRTVSARDITTTLTRLSEARVVNAPFQEARPSLGQRRSWWSRAWQSVWGRCCPRRWCAPHDDEAAETEWYTVDDGVEFASQRAANPAQLSARHVHPAGSTRASRSGSYSSVLSMGLGDASGAGLLADDAAGGATPGAASIPTAAEAGALPRQPLRPRTAPLPQGATY